MKPTKKQMEISVLVSARGSIVFLIVAGVVYFVYHLHLQAASCTAIAGLLLLNAGIMKNKKASLENDIIFIIIKLMERIL